MDNRNHILVVDDEPQITRVLRTTLSAQGYEIRVAHDGESALELMKDWRPDLVLTDIGMPTLDGIEFCRRVRSTSDVPIIILSVREQEKSKVDALDAGADDYVIKPFSMQELLARIRANLRRTPPERPARTITAGDFQIDLDGHKATVRGERIQLTPKEFEVLVYLARNPHKVVTTRALLSAIWGPDSTEQPEYARVFIGHLRRKLEPNSDTPRYIVTEPWVGYRFEPGD